MGQTVRTSTKLPADFKSSIAFGNTNRLDRALHRGCEGGAFWLTYDFPGKALAILMNGQEPLGYLINQPGVQAKMPVVASSAEMTRAQEMLRKNGFRQGGSTSDPGQPLTPDGAWGPNTSRAVKVFSALALHHGNDGLLDGLTGLVTNDVLRALQTVKGRQIWVDTGAIHNRCVTDWPIPPQDIADGFACQALRECLLNLVSDDDRNCTVKLLPNDVSLPSGGPFDGHESHQTGIDCDLMMPTKSGSIRHITWQDPDYDRDRMAAMLVEIKSQQIAQHVWCNDPKLIDAGLCAFLDYHEDHAHLRISPQIIAKMFPSSVESHLTLAWYERLLDSNDKQQDPIVNLTDAVHLPSRGTVQPRVYSANPAVLQFYGGMLPMILSAGEALVVCTESRRIKSTRQLAVSIAEDELRITAKDGAVILFEEDLGKRALATQPVQSLGRTFHLSSDGTLNVLIDSRLID